MLTTVLSITCLSLSVLSVCSALTIVLFSAKNIKLKKRCDMLTECSHDRLDQLHKEQERHRRTHESLELAVAQTGRARAERDELMMRIERIGNAILANKILIGQAYDDSESTRALTKCGPSQDEPENNS